MVRKFYTDLFLGKRLFVMLAASVILFTLSFFFPWLGLVPSIFFGLTVVLFGLDAMLLYRVEEGIFARRSLPEKLSNSDQNEIGLLLENNYTFPVSIGIIDEIPFQFQRRDVWFKSFADANASININYALRPIKRGQYEFGRIRVFVKSPLKIISRRYNFDEGKMLPVYPSFLQMRQFELMAISNRLTEVGVKRIRKIGNSMEFEQIKNYVAGDDYRTLNWKATARKGEMMVNTFVDEKSQHVYCIIDKSRVMKMPFNGLSLLDYAINASLALSNIALLKGDKAGLITISEKVGSIVPADNKPVQIGRILDVLYREKTRYLETNMEALYGATRSVLKQRSLLLFFTNFESLSGLRRQMPVLKAMSKFHLLIVIFFENTELRTLADTPAEDVEGIYKKTIAEKFIFEKKQIVKELAKWGIQSVLTAPENLTANTINRYLQIKARKSL